ncbi:MAG: phage tail spike protein [Pseudolactococcus laudensis]
MSYPILYQAGETNFNHLGLGILKDTISAVVSEDLNGKFELDLVYAYNNKLSKSLLSGNIIKVDAGNILKEQLFTIAQVSKTLDGKISVHAEHVSYIMQDLTLKPKTVIYQQDAQNALKQLLNAIKETDHGFTVTSDVSTISSSTWSVPDFKTPRDVLAGVKGSILDNWGGEYLFDNRRISLLKQRGSYANTIVAYGRNMLDFEQETSILETYTSIYPVVVKTEKDAEVTHTLPELAVDSQYLDKYANRKTLLVDFSDKFDDKNPYSDDKLRVLANAYIKTNKVGIPKVTMTIKTLDLAKMVTDDYKAGRVERLDLADTVKVYFDRLGITTEAKVVGVKWNVLKESYDEYVLGERKATFGTVIRGSIAEVKAVADSAKKDAITALVSADGKNTNYYGNSSDGEPPNPKKGDIWFVKDGDKTIIKTWNGSSWVDLVSSDWQEIFNAKLTEELSKAKVELDAALAEKDKALAELDVKLAENVKILDQTKIDLNQNKIDVNAALLEKDKALAGLDEKIADELVIIDTSVKKAQADANTATTRADDAVDKANASVAAVQENTHLINDVNAIANNAKSQAQTAATNAQTALASANAAKDNANKAISDAGKLSEDVLALDTIANQAKSDADAALINANKGITDAKTALSKAIGVDTRVTTEITNVNNTLATKANSTTVDALSDTVSSQGTAISQNATDIKLKADSTVVNAIKGTVDSQGTLISQNASDIKIKANKSEVDTLTGRVSANETAIDVTSQGVSTLVTKTDGTNTALSQFKQDYEGFKGTVYTKGQTDTKVSTVQQSVDNFKTTVSNTYSSKSETDSKVTAVQENVDKLGTYTAYANSSDGKDRFTTVYPNLNLLDGTKDFSGFLTPLGGWENDGTFKGLTVKKRTWPWGGIYKTFTAPKDGIYTFSAYVKSSGDSANITRYVEKNRTDYRSEWAYKVFENNFDWLRDSFTVTLKAGDTISARYEISGSASDTILWNAGHKWEEDSIATPYMPSEKELTSNDIPKYVGYSVRQSENPKDFSWQLYGGLNSYNIIKATTSIEQNSKDIALKANKTEVDTLSGKVSTAEGAITTMAGQIKLKANQTDVDTVKGRVTSAEGSISLISGKVALKANKTEVDTLSGKVSTAESSLKIQDGQIKALNTKTDGHTTQIGTLESSYNGFKSTISKIQTDVSGKAGKTELSQLSQDLSGFKNTVSSTYLSKSNASGTYADKVSVTSQINQSATAVTSNVQSWTNNKLTAYSTTQQTATSITNAVASKADKSQVTQLSDQITSTVTSLTNETLITTQMIQGARLKHPNYPDMPMVGIPVTYGESYTVSSNIPNSGTTEAVIADVFYLRTPETTPNSNINGVFDGNSVTSTALYKIYIVFRSQSVADKVTSGQYWVKATKTPASQSQITQLSTDINLRVSKGDIVNQINISPESILIAGNKIQITGHTYIENGVIENAKIKDLSASKLTAGTIDASLINVTKINASNITTGTLNANRIGANSITATHISISSLSALSGNLGTLTAGVIDAAVVTVKNINASNITTGTLSADRIAANSITATHISVSSLSALSANLGLITAGTINAATVNVININAASITTGTLNAARIGANSITADKIKATSLDLFSNDSYTNVRSDGMRLQSKAQIIFGPWIDVNGNRRSTQGVYIGGFGGGTNHVAFTRSDGTAFMLRAENGMDYGANDNISINDLNVFDSTHFWKGVRVHGNLLADGYIAMGGSVLESSIQYDKPSGTMNFRVPGGRSGSYFWFNQRVISEGSFDSRSKLSLKNVKGRYEGNALREIVNTDIAEYSYKNDPKRRQLSPIIDDINEIKKYHLPDIINDGESVNLYAMGSLSWLAIKQLAQKLENIEEKLDAIA